MNLGEKGPAAIGRRAAEFIADHETTTTPCCPAKSPYGRLLQWKGKVLMLGVDLKRCTYFHCLEEVAGLDKIWSVDQRVRDRIVIRHDGTLLHMNYHSHMNGKSENYSRIEPELIAAGILRKSQAGDPPMMLLDAAASAEWLVPRFRANPQFFW